MRGINRYGRTSQGVRVMNLREGDEVSAVALIVETEAPASTASDEPVSLVDESEIGDGDDGVVATDPPEDPEGEN